MTGVAATLSHHRGGLIGAAEEVTDIAAFGDDYKGRRKGRRKKARQFFITLSPSIDGKPGQTIVAELP
jgi:hypothetical protein